MFFPIDASFSGHWIDNLFYLAFGLVAVTFVLVIGILLAFILKYRERPGHRASYITGETSRARWLTLLFSIVIFIVIDLNLAFHDHVAWEHAIGGPVLGQPLQLEILAQQFAWNIRYAGSDGQFGTSDDIVSINQMVVPNHKPVILSMKSKDVIHSFFLPNFRIKQDVVPGMKTMMKFQPVKTGQFDIACAEHCGLGHYRMRGILKIVNDQEFEKWLSDKAKQPIASEAWGWEWK